MAYFHPSYLSKDAPEFHPTREDAFLAHLESVEKIKSCIGSYQIRFQRNLFERVCVIDGDEVKINIEHPHFIERVGTEISLGDPIFEQRLQRYVGTVATSAFMGMDIPNLPKTPDFMFYVTDAFERTFLRQWAMISKFADFMNKKKEVPRVPSFPKLNHSSPELANFPLRSMSSTRALSSSISSSLRPGSSWESSLVTSTGSSLAQSFETSPTRSSFHNTPKEGPSAEIESLKSNLYVCGIPKSWSKAHLREMFAEYGEIISCKLWYQTSDSKDRNAGSGFVQFNRRDEAAQAIQGLNDKIVGSMLRPLQVKFANASSFGGQIGAPCDNLYVSGLPCTFNDTLLHKLFEPFGDIHSVLVLNKRSQYKNATGFVKFEKSDDAACALKAMNHQEIIGTDEFDTFRIACSWAKGKPRILETISGRRNIYVTGIVSTWTELDVIEYFDVFGKIRSVAVMSPKGQAESENPKWVAFVQFETAESALHAIEVCHGVRLPGQDRPMSIRFSKHQKLQ